MKILALDIGKSKSVFVELETQDGVKQFGKIATTPEQVQELLVKRRPDRLVLEAGPAAGWICDIAWSMKIATQVANTNDERWHWKKAKKKNDRVDAEKLAVMSQMDCLPLVHVPSPAMRQWRSLIEYRHGLVDRRTAVKNSIRSIFERQGRKLTSRGRAWSKAGVMEIEKEARDLSECGAEELWRGQLKVELQSLRQLQEQIEQVEAKLEELASADDRIKRVKSAPCVGPRLSELVVTALDDASRFANAKQVGAYAGLAPRQWQSGQSCREGHISRAGNPLLREVLVEVSWIGVRTNTWMKEVYENVRRGSSKRKKIAIVAVARRLLVRLWAMLRDGSDWKQPMTQPQPRLKELSTRELALAAAGIT